MRADPPFLRHAEPAVTVWHQAADEPFALTATDIHCSVHGRVTGHVGQQQESREETNGITTVRLTANELSVGI